MAVFVPVVNGLNVNLRFTTRTGDTAINSFWVKNTAAWTAASVLTMLEAFETWFTTGGGGTVTYQHEMSNGCHLVESTGRDMTTQNGISIAHNPSPAIAGTDAGTLVPPGLSFAITARTGLAGKSYRGRTFLVDTTANFYDSPPDGTISQTHADNAVGAFDAMISAVSTAIATCSLVVCSRYYQPGGPHTPTVPRAAGVLTPILHHGYHDLFQDFQKRRSPAHHRLR